jgi:hypothetical protein
METSVLVDKLANPSRRNGALLRLMHLATATCIFCAELWAPLRPAFLLALSVPA